MLAMIQGLLLTMGALCAVLWQLRALMDERARLVIDCHCRPAGRHTKRCENLKARFS